jgi:demethylmenaquinone methyltransferase/2-methoxy-6-polyprenyl-1,4-benzoquinol methylase
MTIRTESRVAIAGDVRNVWAYVCDVGRWPEWAPTVLECWIRGGAPLQPGSRIEQRAKDLWRTHGRSQEVTNVEAPRSVAFAGPMGPSAARWGMELEPRDDGQTAAMMWIEVDLAGVMRAAPGLLKGSIQRVSDREMAAIKAAVESAARRGAGAWMSVRTMSRIDRQREQERLIQLYRRKAKHFDLTSRLYPAPGYPQRAQRHRAVHTLGLRAGDRVIDIACGTGVNFPLIEEVIGPEGRIVGVDLTDAMLARARDRTAAHGWRNVSLVQCDAADFDFPTEVDAVLCTYALSQVPECAEVISHGAAALSEGGRWVVLDLKVPDKTPWWLAQPGTALVRPFASIDAWMMRRPWEAIRAAMEEDLVDFSWTELLFGTAFLAAGCRGR